MAKYSLTKKWIHIQREYITKIKHTEEYEVKYICMGSYQDNYYIELKQWVGV